MKHPWLCVVLASCALPPPSRDVALSTAGLVASSGGRLRALSDCNARGDGLTDDTQALQDCLNRLGSSGGVLLLEGGAFRVTRQSPRTFALELRRAHGVSIAGPGRIEKEPADHAGRDFSILQILDCSGVSISGVEFDGSMASMVEGEQSHAVNVLSSIDVQITSSRFLNVHGDGVRLVGSATGWVSEVLISGNVFRGSQRSGVGIQRAVSDVVISNNVFSNISDQHIDFEPTGGDLPGPERIVITGNSFGLQDKAYVLAVMGVGSEHPARDIVVSGNVMGGAVNLRTFDGLVFSNNVVDASRTQRVKHGVFINGYGKDLTFADNQITGRQTGVEITAHGTTSPPEHLTLSGNVIEAAQTAIDVSTADSVTISGNRLSGGVRGIRFRAERKDEPVGSLRVVSNEVLAPEGLAVIAANSPIDDVTVLGNRFFCPAETAVVVSGSHQTLFTRQALNVSDVAGKEP